MLNDDFEDFLIKISEMNPEEQLILANKLIEELTVNNNCFEEQEYDIEKSNQYIENLSNFSVRFKEKLELNLLEDGYYQ